MIDSLISLLAFIFTLGVLITVHEFGHFCIARYMGVKVLRFSIGVGWPIWKRQSRDGVEYVIAILPFGGYVKMLDEREGTVQPEELKFTFSSKSVYKRLAIVLAGPLFNLLFAILAYSSVFMIGVPDIKPILGEPRPGSIAAECGFQNGDLVVTVDGKATPTLSDMMTALVDLATAEKVILVEVLPEYDVLYKSDLARFKKEHTGIRKRTLVLDNRVTNAATIFDDLGLVPIQSTLPAVIGQVLPGEAAARAGLQPGDRILSVDGEPILDWQHWRRNVELQSPDRSLNVHIEREGIELLIDIKPSYRRDRQGKQVGFIGAVAESQDYAHGLQIMVRYNNPLYAVGAAVRKTWDMSLLTIHMLGRILTGKASLENISGPIAIAQFAGQAANAGAVAFLSMLALVSLSLGVLNLLPVPVFDGGYILYYLIELVKGSPLPEAVQNFGQQVGISILLLLVGLAIFNDFSRLLG